MAAGLIAALLFLVLGIAEMRRQAPPAIDLAPPAMASSGVVAPVAVLAVASRPIETGETITAAMVSNASADPARFPAVATPSEVIGKVATRPIAAGAMIQRVAVDVTTKLAIRVPVGMRAISMDTTAEIAVAGLVRPGDRVDVQVVYPGADALSGARGEAQSRAQTLLQMVPVLAVGELVVGTQPASGTEDALASPPPPARTVTLALNPDQVSVLSLAKATGSLYLSLRNPADNQEVAIAAARSAAPAPRAAPAALPASTPVRRQPARAAPHSIDLVVGGRHEVIYSGEAKK